MFSTSQISTLKKLYQSRWLNFVLNFTEFFHLLFHSEAINVSEISYKNIQTNYVELECLDYSTLFPCKTGLPFDEDSS